jgi:hypothetical protein
MQQGLQINGRQTICRVNLQFLTAAVDGGFRKAMVFGEFGE